MTATEKTEAFKLLIAKCPGLMKLSESDCVGLGLLFQEYADYVSEQAFKAGFESQMGKSYWDIDYKPFYEDYKNQNKA